MKDEARGSSASSSIAHHSTFSPRAYLQLVRLPNVFTAMADILLGFLLTHESLEPWPQFALLLAASSLLYSSGMVLNDYFDVPRDAIERPFRPIPSGRVQLRAALLIGSLMLVGGTLLAWLVTLLAGDWRPGIIATLLAAAIVLYDGVLKKTPLAPVVMGTCRTLNVLLGMSVSLAAWTPAYAAVAGGIGLYIVGVTTYARSEARVSHRGKLALGVAVLVAGLALVASLPYWATGAEEPPIDVPPQWYVAWALLAAFIGWRCLQGMISPRPELVQTAVRNCIFSLIVIDAAACLAVQGPFWGIVILLLLVPMLVLGRWIYST